jgi:tetratricopeptide (TPR) repeat protein
MSAVASMHRVHLASPMLLSKGMAGISGGVVLALSFAALAVGQSSVPGGVEDVKDRAKRSLAEAAVWIGKGETERARASLDQFEALEADVTEKQQLVIAKVMRASLAEKLGKFSEARERLREAEAQLPSDAPDELRFAVLEQKMAWLHSHGELREASLVAEEILSLAELRRNMAEVARYGQESGMLLYKLGDLNAAESRASRAAVAAADAKLQGELARTKKLQGNIALARRQGVRARSLYEEALNIFVETDNTHDAANCHYNLATLAAGVDDRAAMRTHLDEAVSLFTQAGSLGGVGLCRMLDGEAYLRAGDLLRAGERLDEAERIFTRTRNRVRLGQTKKALAALASARGEKAKAVELGAEAERLLGAGADHR